MDENRIRAIVQRMVLEGDLAEWEPYERGTNRGLEIEEYVELISKVIDELSE